MLDADNVTHFKSLRGTITITDPDGRTLETHKITEQNDLKAADIRGKLLDGAKAKYGLGNFYLFAAWNGSLCVQPKYMRDGSFTPRRCQ